jgi:hypothetical protein
MLAATIVGPVGVLASPRGVPIPRTPRTPRVLRIREDVHLHGVLSLSRARLLLRASAPRPSRTSRALRFSEGGHLPGVILDAGSRT